MIIANFIWDKFTFDNALQELFYDNNYPWRENKNYAVHIYHKRYRVEHSVTEMMTLNNTVGDLTRFTIQACCLTTSGTIDTRARNNDIWRISTRNLFLYCGQAWYSFRCLQKLSRDKRKLLANFIKLKFKKKFTSIFHE